MSRSWVRFALMFTVTYGPGFALAQESDGPAEEPADLVAQAEEAFVDIEYERAKELARQALNAGGLDPVQTANMYRLIGTTSAFLDQPEDAYLAYRRQLAVDPDAEMDPSLPPQLRTPFLRARGWWSAQPESFELGFRVADPGAGQDLRFIVSLADPIDLVSRITLRVRAPDAQAFVELELPAAESTTRAADTFALDEEIQESAVRFDYILVAYDATGNVLAFDGSEVEPAIAANPRVARRIGPSGELLEPPGEEFYESWWFWTIVGAVVAGGAAVGIYFAIPPRIDSPLQVTFGL